MYEIRVVCHKESDGPSYEVEHPHPDLPDRETIVLLKDEALETYKALYDNDEPDCIHVTLTFYDKTYEPDDDTDDDLHRVARIPTPDELEGGQ